MAAEQDSAIRAVYDALDTDDAMAKAQAALKKAKDKKDKKMEAQANEALMSVHGAKEDYGAVQAAADSAMALYKELKDSEGQSGVLGKLIEIKLYTEKPVDVMKIATDALEASKKAGDTKGQASALLLCAQVHNASNKRLAAINVAKEALKLHQGLDDKHGQAQALLSIITTDFQEERGEAISASEERVKIFRDLGDKSSEASALITLANAHIARMGKKTGTCSIASAEDTIAVLKTAKEAYALCKSSDAELVDGAMQAVGNVLMMNGVPGEVIQSMNDPDEVFQDVMSGKYTSPQNALPPAPQPKQLKLEDVVPSSKQLDRGKFSWNNPTAQYTYTLVWQPTKDREVRNKKPRSVYDLMFLNTAAKSRALTQAFQTKCNDASEKGEPLVVHINSHDCSIALGTMLMNNLNILSAMVHAKLTKIVFLNVDEAQVDYSNTAVRHVNTHPSQLAMLRSARLECPNMTIGYVGGDAASWFTDPAPMIESIFDTVECDESEITYKRGDPFAPLLIHRPLDETVQFVKAKRK